MKNLKLNWGNMFMGLVFAFCLWLISLIVFSSFADKKIRGYYLHAYNSKLTIMVDIDWSSDQSIELDRNITYNEAIEMVERLNKTVNKSNK